MRCIDRKACFRTAARATGSSPFTQRHVSKMHFAECIVDRPKEPKTSRDRCSSPYCAISRSISYYKKKSINEAAIDNVAHLDSINKDLDAV